MTKKELKAIIKEIAILSTEADQFVTGRRFVVIKAISGTGIDESDHRSKAEALSEARRFIEAQNSIGSKKAGEHVVRTNEGYILKDSSGATVGLAVILEPRGTGTEFQQQNEKVSS